MLKIFYLFLLFISFGYYAQDDKVWMHPNRGQWHENINYKIDLSGGEMLIEQNAFTYVFHNISELTHNHAHEKSDQVNENSSEEKKFKKHVIKTNFIGSNENHEIIEDKKSTFYRNYFLGNDHSKWKTDVFSLSKVIYPEFYDGIDLYFESEKSALKYSFKAKPNSDASKIKYEITGAQNIKIDKLGNLIIEHTFGTISDSKPIAWTIDKKGNKTQIEIKFKLKNKVVSFDFPKGYNQIETLIIDPSITFSSYTGSTVDNWGCTATPDLQGNLFAGGTVFGVGYPTVPGFFISGFSGGEAIGYDGFDISLSKFNANGTAFLYSTYVGGSGNECPNSMITNAAGELFIMGVTSSNNFPNNGTGFQNIHAGGSQINLESSQGYSKTDIYVIKINPAGNAVLNSTYVGGSGNDGVNLGTSSVAGELVFNYGDNFRGEIILDNTGSIIVASSTRSSNFPTVNASQAGLNGVQDAVLFKLNPTLSTMIFSTYYGGSGIDSGNAVAVNSLNEIYMTGGTMSNNLNVPAGHTNSNSGGEADGYLTRFNGATSAILSGTYIGTSDYDQSYFVQVDIDDFVYTYGQTFGAMTISPGLFGNANAQQFIRKFDVNLASMIWNTKVGGSSQRISTTAFLVSNCYEIYISGWGGDIISTNISGFPITADAFQTSSDGDGFYIAVYDPNMSALQYATFMGGPSDDHVDGGTSRFDKNGRIYHAVCSACGGNANGFVSTPGVVAPVNGNTGFGGNCNLAAFKFDLNSINAIVTDPNFIICIPNPVQFFNNSTEGDVFFWDFGDLTTSNDPNPSHIYTQVGSYIVKLVVSDSEGCKAPDSTSFDVEVGSFEAGSVTPPPTICKGTPYQFDAFGGLNYLWSPANVLDDATIANPTAIIFDTTTFSVVISDTCGVDTVFVTLNVFQDQISVSNDTSICLGFSTPIEVFGAISQVWTPNTFISNANSANPIVNPDTTTTYIVTATTFNNCIFKDSVLVDVFFNLPIPILDDTVTMCAKSFATIIASGAPSYFWSPNQFINTTVGDTVNVNPPADFTYFCDFTNACGTVRDTVFVDVIIPNIRAFSDTILCLGQSANLHAMGVSQYQWSPKGTIDNFISDSVVATPLTTTNYLVIGIDEFGCRDSAYVLVQVFPINQVNAGITVFALIGEEIQLNAETSISGGTFQWFPESNLSCPTCQSTSANPNRSFDYTVFFTDTNGCTTSDIVHIDYPGILYIPNTFTPDGSKFNEVFRAYGEGIKSFEMLIFNRWGELICTLDSMDDYWDGKYKGEICQDGTYTWVLTYDDNTDEIKTITGHVNLIR